MRAGGALGESRPTAVAAARRAAWDVHPPTSLMGLSARSRPVRQSGPGAGQAIWGRRLSPTPPSASHKRDTHQKQEGAGRFGNRREGDGVIWNILELYFKSDTQLIKDGQPVEFDRLEKGQSLIVQVETKDDRMVLVKVSIPSSESYQHRAVRPRRSHLKFTGSLA